MTKQATRQCLQEDCGFDALGMERRLAQGIFYNQRGAATIEAFHRRPAERTKPSPPIRNPRLGSARARSPTLREKMNSGDHVLVLVHGFNVSWSEGVASAASLQSMLNRHCGGDRAGKRLSARPRGPVQLAVGRPANSRSGPIFSDRSEAKLSGYALGRGILKLRDYLIDATHASRRQKGEPPCGRSIPSAVPSPWARFVPWISTL